MIQALFAAVLLLQQGSAPPAMDPKHQADIDHDIEVGKKAVIEADKEFKASTNKEYIDRVNRIGNELAKIARVTQVHASWGDSRLNPFDYTFKVVKDDDVNAFSLPGGHIYIFEGLVRYVESDDELAGVIGHEISHAAFRHLDALEHEQNKIDALTIPLILLSILKGGQNAGGGVIMSQMVGTALSNGWSLKAETAADYGGFQYLLHTQYNPTAMLTVMERLAKDERASPGKYQGIFRTHPPSRDRALAIIAQMRKRHIPIRRSMVTTSLRTVAAKGDLAFGKIHLVTLAGADGESRANALSPVLNGIFDNVPAGYEFTASGGDVLYQNRLLIHLTDDDAQAAKLPIAQLAEQTVRNFQSAVFSLRFSIYDTDD